MADPATKTSAPAAAMLAIVFALTPPSTSISVCQPFVGDEPPDRAHLVQGAGDEGLPAEPRVDAHDQNEIDVRDDPLQGVHGGGRVQHDPRPDARIADEAAPCGAGAGRSPTCTQMRDAPGAGEVGNVAVRVGDHQVHVQRQAR